MSLSLTAALAPQGPFAALLEGRVRPAGVELQFAPADDVPGMFRRMVREQAFDLCELALATYLCAREHGARFTALPVFPVRGFHHGAIAVAADGTIRGPQDLAGRAVGVNRGWTVTSGLWVRSLLQQEHGLDWRRIHWRVSGDEHVASYRLPPGVQALEGGPSLAQRVLDGELAAAIGIDASAPGLRPLIPDAEAAGLAAFRARGHYPISHVVVVRDETLQAHPGLAAALLEAFEAARRDYLARLRQGPAARQGGAERLHGRLMDEYGADPLPYGLAANRAVLEEAVDAAFGQAIVGVRPPLADLFVGS